MKRSVEARFLVLLISCLIVLLTACSPQPEAPLQLTQKDSGSAQTLSAGQQLIISLESNPTTGYRWGVDGTTPAQLEQAGEPTYTSGSSAIGAGGTEVFTFTAKDPGEGTLRLKYFRSFEPTAAPAGTFEVIVKVD